MRSIQTGEDVLARDGSRLGTVERIVVDESGHRVTHVVVAGRAVPAGRVRDAGPDGLAADLDHEDLQDLPDAGEAPFAAPGENWEPPEGYAMDNFLRFADAFNRMVAQGPFEPPVHIEMGASEIHEITSDSPVWCGNRLVGRVDRLLWDDSGQVAGVIVKHGFLHGRRFKVPAERVQEVVANNVHLDLSPEELEHVPDYDPLREEG